MVSTLVFAAADASRDRYQDYLLLKKDIIDQNTAKGYWMTIWNFIYYRNAVILIALIDLVAIFLVITVRYSKPEKQTIFACRQSIQKIIDTVPRGSLQQPQNPDRIALGELNSTLSKVMSYKAFRIRIIKLEFLRECLSLNVICLLMSYLCKHLFSVAFPNTST